MTSITWSAEGGTDGTAISTANSGGASGTAFDTCQRGTNATNEFDSAQFANGALSALIATGATSTTAYNRWNAAITALWASGLTTHYGRIYFRLSALPAASRVIAEFLDTTAATHRADIQILAAGQVRLRNAASGTVATTTAVVSTGTWYRLEYRIDGSTTGAYELHLYALNSTTSIEDIVGGTANFGGTIGAVSYGYVSNGASLPSLWFDGIQINDAALPGPETYTATIAPTGLAVAVAIGSPTVAQAMTVAPNGLAVAVAFGSPTVSQALTVAPTGLAIAVTFGQPAASQAMTVAPAGLAVPVGLGVPAVTQALTVAPGGIAVPVDLGAPVVAQALAAAPAGLAVPVAFGQPTVAFVPPGPVRDISFTVGPPEVSWTAGTPRAGWSAGPPQTDWTAAPPKT